MKNDDYLELRITQALMLKALADLTVDSRKRKILNDHANSIKERAKKELEK